MREPGLSEPIPLDGVLQHSADDPGCPPSDWTAPHRTPAGRETFLAVPGGASICCRAARTPDNLKAGHDAPT